MWKLCFYYDVYLLVVSCSVVGTNIMINTYGWFSSIKDHGLDSYETVAPCSVVGKSTL